MRLHHSCGAGTAGSRFDPQQLMKRVWVGLCAAASLAKADVRNNHDDACERAEEGAGFPSSSERGVWLAFGRIGAFCPGALDSGAECEGCGVGVARSACPRFWAVSLDTRSRRSRFFAPLSPRALARSRGPRRAGSQIDTALGRGGTRTTGAFLMRTQNRLLGYLRRARQNEVTPR